MRSHQQDLIVCTPAPAFLPPGRNCTHTGTYMPPTRMHLSMAYLLTYLPTCSEHNQEVPGTHVGPLCAEAATHTGAPELSNARVAARRRRTSRPCCPLRPGGCHPSGDRSEPGAICVHGAPAYLLSVVPTWSLTVRPSACTPFTCGPTAQRIRVRLRSRIPVPLQRWRALA